MVSKSGKPTDSSDPGRPFVEALRGVLGKGWTVVRCARGEGYVDFASRIMGVPFDEDALSRNIRRHELGHAAWTRRLPHELAELYNAELPTVQVVEDSRVQFLLSRKAGLNLDEGFLEPSTVITGIQALLSKSDYKEVTRYLVAAGFSGTHDVIRNCVQEVQRTAEHPDAAHCLRLASNAFLEIACDPSEATMGKVAHSLDNEFRTLGWAMPVTSGSKKTGSQKPRKRRYRDEWPDSKLLSLLTTGDNNDLGPGDPNDHHLVPQKEFWSSLVVEAILSKLNADNLPRSITRRLIKESLCSEFVELTRDQLEQLLAEDRDLFQSLLETPQGRTKPHFPLSMRDHEPWGTLEIQKAPLTIRVGPGLVRRRRATDYGGHLRNPHRLLIDGKYLSRDDRVHGGVVCVDYSGSMSWKHDQFHEFLKVAPGTTIGIYAGEGDRGILKVVAANGWIASEADCKLPFSLNIVDLPALKWAAAQRNRGLRGPILWLSDGRVTAAHEKVTINNRKEISKFIKANRITRIETAQEAVKLLRRQGS